MLATICLPMNKKVYMDYSFDHWNFCGHVQLHALSDAVTEVMQQRNITKILFIHLYPFFRTCLQIKPLDIFSCDGSSDTKLHKGVPFGD